MHTTCRFLYSKGKIHTSYFRKTECETARPAFVRIDNLVHYKGKDELLGGLQCMIVNQKHKAGVTLAEVLAVITIMGILAGIGVAGLQSAVANARIKDAAFNVTAFMERTANEARRLNSSLCVVREDAQNLGTYKGKCSEVTNVGLNNAVRIDGLMLESPNRILQSSEVTPSATLGLVNFATDGAEFTPRRGLSAAPVQGFFAMQYGGQGRYGAAAKVKENNRFTPLMKFDDTDWSGI